jgi:hypothetical protein
MHFAQTCFFNKKASCIHSSKKSGWNSNLNLWVFPPAQGVSAPICDGNFVFWQGVLPESQARMGYT